MIAGGAIICAILNWFFKDPIIILATGCTGAYLTVSGIGFFAGGFPSLTEIYNLFKDENVSVPVSVQP